MWKIQIRTEKAVVNHEMSTYRDAHNVQTAYQRMLGDRAEITITRC